MFDAATGPMVRPRELPSDGSATLRTLTWSPSVAPTSSAPVVVLLHGLGDGADIWRSMMAAWQIPLSVVAFDLPGHGRSPWFDDAPYDVPNLAGWVAKALSAQGIHRPVLVGHSLGARVAVELASRTMLNPRGTVLVDMSGHDSHETTAAVAAHLDSLIAGAPSLERLVNLVGGRLPLANSQAVATAVQAMATITDGRWRLAFDPAIRQLLAPARDPQEIWRLLARLRGPAAFIRGSYSAVVDRRMATRITEAVPWRPAIVETVDKAGHAVPLEQPVLLARAVETCLRRWRVAA